MEIKWTWCCIENFACWTQIISTSSPSHSHPSIHYTKERDKQISSRNQRLIVFSHLACGLMSFEYLRSVFLVSFRSNFSLIVFEIRWVLDCCFRDHFSLFIASADTVYWCWINSVNALARFSFSEFLWMFRGRIQRN